MNKEQFQGIQEGISGQFSKMVILMEWVSGALFLLVGIIYDRTGTKIMDNFGREIALQLCQSYAKPILWAVYVGWPFQFGPFPS